MKLLPIAVVFGLALFAGGVFLIGDGGVSGVASPGPTGPRSQPSQATTGERLVRLQVDNMYCASCPYIVRQALERTPGVTKASVMFREKLAVVRYDPGKTDVAALVSATTRIGFPSRLATN